MVDDKLVPLSGKNTQQVLSARPGAGTLNDHFAWAPALKQMEFLQTVIASEITIVGELAQNALFSVASKGLKAAKIVQKIAKTKHVAKAAKAFQKLSKLIEKGVLTRASAAFAKAFYDSLKGDLAKYTLNQLAGKEEKIALRPNQVVSQISFDGGTSISPNKDASQGVIGNPYIPMSKPPTIDFSKAIIHGAAAFANSILVVDKLAEPISKEATKKMTDLQMAGAVGTFVKDFVSKLGNDFFSGAIATAALNAMNDNDKAKSYPKHLTKVLTDKLLSYLTEDFVKGVLSVAAFGIGD